MPSLPILAWVTTAICGPIAVVTGARLASSRGPADLMDRVLHLVMALGMLAMFWPVGTGNWTGICLTVFGAGTIWYAIRALRSSGGRAVRLSTHCLLMMAMVWMSVAATSHPSGHHHVVPLWTALAGLPLVAGIIACGVVITADALRSWRMDTAGARVDHGADAAMCAGMVIVCWPMLFA